MNPTEELAYIRGSRAALVRLLSTIVRELGYESPEARAKNWIIEREDAISTLRQVCGHHGDNDWADQLHLSDIIEKHLWDHLGLK